MSNSSSNETVSDMVASSLAGMIVLGLLAYCMPGLIASLFGWTPYLVALVAWVSVQPMWLVCIFYLLYGVCGLIATAIIVCVPVFPIYGICKLIEKEIGESKQQGHIVEYREHEPAKQDSSPVVVRYSMIRRTTIIRKGPGSR